MKTFIIQFQTMIQIKTMIISGGSEGKGTNPWDAIGLNSFYDLSKKVAGNKIQK